jgi:hypothetical protein
MTEHGWDTDGWPEVQAQVMAADILAYHATMVPVGTLIRARPRVLERAAPG